MGIPKSLLEATAFPRTFRFLFIPAKNPDIQYLITKVSIDFYQKSFDAHILETIPNLSSQDWIIDMNDKDYSDDYKLIALDGMGNQIYVLEFKRAKAVYHNVKYDYGISEIVTHHVGFEFVEMTRSKTP